MQGRGWVWGNTAACLCSKSPYSRICSCKVLKLTRWLVKLHSAGLHNHQRCTGFLQQSFQKMRWKEPETWDEFDGVESHDDATQGLHVRLWSAYCWWRGFLFTCCLSVYMKFSRLILTVPMQRLGCRYRQNPVGLMQNLMWESLPRFLDRLCGPCALMVGIAAGLKVVA